MSEPPRQGPSSESHEPNSELPERAFDTEQFKTVPPPAGPPRISPPFVAPPAGMGDAESAGESPSPAEVLNEPQTTPPAVRHTPSTTRMPIVAPVTGQVQVSARPFGVSPNLLFIGALLTAAILVAVVAAAALSVQDDLSNEVAVAESSLVEFSTVSNSSLPESAADLPSSPPVTGPPKPTTTRPSTSSTSTSAPPASSTTVVESDDSFGPGSSPPAAPSAEPSTTASQPPPECDPNYGGCVPIGEDVDCAGDGDGPLFQSWPVPVSGTDIYDLDPDNNQIACG